MKNNELSKKEYIKDLTLKVNQYLLEVLDLSITPEGYIYSNQLDSILSMNRKFLKMYKIDKSTDIAFRPIYNPKLMLVLYSIFAKMLYQNDHREVEYWEYSPGNLKKDKISIRIKEVGYDEVLETGQYWNDSIRFLDVISLLAEACPPVDLVELDELLHE